MVQHKEVYRNLRGEMVKIGITNKNIAELLHIHTTTVGNKFHNRGGCDFTIKEAVSIQKEYFEKIALEELFKRE